MDTCICMAESLHCSPELITTLLVGICEYKVKSFLKKNRGKREKYKKTATLLSLSGKLLRKESTVR